MKSTNQEHPKNNFKMSSAKTILFAGIALVAITTVSVASNPISMTAESEIINNGISPLCNAIYKGDLTSVKKFIEYGADVNEVSNGMTPLMFAARYNKVDIIKYLLEKGADKEKKDERGYTAKQYAEFSKAAEALAFLKQA